MKRLRERFKNNHFGPKNDPLPNFEQKQKL